jgi:large subunit ribosomal protein L18
VSVKKINAARVRRACRVRQKIATQLPRVSVFRSLKHIYAQIIDDARHVTLASCSTLDIADVTGDKTAFAFAIGKELAKRSKEVGITAVVFDRGAYRYHGRVKAVADGLREGGIQV